jgi:hypothetical protein
MPVVSQSIMKAMVPVGASSVVWALRKPLALPRIQGVVPDVAGGAVQVRAGRRLVRDAVGGVAVLLDDAQERLLVLAVFGERAAVVAGDDRALAVGLGGHDRGDGAGVGLALGGVVGEAAAHQQRAEVGVAEAERPEQVRVVGDLGVG